MVLFVQLIWLGPKFYVTQLIYFIVIILQTEHLIDGKQTYATVRQWATPFKIPTPSVKGLDNFAQWECEFHMDRPIGQLLFESRLCYCKAIAILFKILTPPVKGLDNFAQWECEFHMDWPIGQLLFESHLCYCKAIAILFKILTPPVKGLDNFAQWECEFHMDWPIGQLLFESHPATVGQ